MLQWSSLEDVEWEEILGCGCGFRDGLVKEVVSSSFFGGEEGEFLIGTAGSKVEIFSFSTHSLLVLVSSSVAMGLLFCNNH